MTGKRGKPSRKVRLEDIATRCGVSLSTVSRALAGEKGVRPDIRERIMETARTLNYAVAASVAGRKVILVASSVAMIDYVRNQFTAQVLEGLHRRAEVQGVEVITQPIENGAAGIAILQEAARDEAVAGFLFLSIDDDEVLSLTRDLGKPTVLINSDDPLMQLSSVTPCNRSAARMGTEYLLRLGHRRVAFLAKRGRRTIERRFEGWRDAMIAHGLEPAPELVITVDDWLPELAAQAMEKRAEEGRIDFTAILAAGESLAAGAMRGLSNAGYTVPGDISVIGMDDLPQAAFYNPPLTAIHIPMREIGQTALSLLLGNELEPEAPARRIELACHMVERQSVAAVAAE